MLVVCVSLGCESHRASATDFDQYPPIGLLGRPLGEVVVVRGQVIECDRKDCPAPLFLVESIAGRNAPTELRIWLFPLGAGADIGVSPEEMTIGHRYECKVYESGAFVGTPGGVWRENVQPFATAGFHFEHQAIVLHASKLDR